MFRSEALRNYRTLFKKLSIAESFCFAILGKKCTYSTSVHKYSLMFPMLYQAIFFTFGTNIIRFLFPVF